jgi:hypothetical protein
MIEAALVPSLLVRHRTDVVIIGVLLVINGGVGFVGGASGRQRDRRAEPTVMTPGAGTPGQAVRPWWRRGTWWWAMLCGFGSGDVLPATAAPGTP